MKSLMEKLQAKEIVVFDGATGTQLMKYGMPGGACPEALNLMQPDIPEQVARDYQRAGADVVETNTFGGSPAKLAMHDYAEKTEDINKRAAEIARKGAGPDAFVAGSCGPTGEMLEPFGEADPDTLYSGFVRQMQGLADGGVDLFCIETMSDLQEACLAVKAAKSVAPHIPVAATMTFNRSSRGFFTMMGVSVEAAAAGLEEAGADILGSNCGNGIEEMVEIAHVFAKITSLPLLIQANAGQPVLKNGRTHYPETPEFFARHVEQMIHVGVGIIGGCCGTTPDHIRAIRGAVDAYQAKST